MKKDPRLETVRLLIESNQIMTFREIFDFVPVSVLADKIGMNYQRMINMIENPHCYKLIDYIKIAEPIGASERAIVNLAMNQIETEKSKELKEMYEMRIKRKKRNQQ